MDYMNSQYGTDYDLEPVYDAIDDYIAPLKKKISWGYDIPYALSAKYNLHRTYAEFLLNKWKLRTSDIERILANVSQSESEYFNEKYIESLYRNYMSVEVDDSNSVKMLKKEFVNRNLLLIAPGMSIVNQKESIETYIKEYKPIVIGIHCIPDFLELDYVFFSNIKRFDALYEESDTKVIVASNLMQYNRIPSDALITNYSTLAYHEEEFSDDSVLMFLNLLKILGIERLSVAGFDGFGNKENDFYISSLCRNVSDISFSDKVKLLLRNHYSKLKINFITDSFYKDYNNLSES